MTETLGKKCKVITQIMPDSHWFQHYRNKNNTKIGISLSCRWVLGAYQFFLTTDLEMLLLISPYRNAFRKQFDWDRF